LLAEIADQSILTEFVTDLLVRSSLIVALYWRRRETTCDVEAHRNLVNAVAKNNPKDASDLMSSLLIDLLSGLELNSDMTTVSSLADALR
jgi:DNA-binding GntR family transcriptional regulator